MRALVADDQVLSRRILREVLAKAGWKQLQGLLSICAWCRNVPRRRRLLGERDPVAVGSA